MCSVQFNDSADDFEFNFLKLVARVKNFAISMEKIGDSIAWGGVYGRLLSINHSLLLRDDDLENRLVAKYLKVGPEIVPRNALSKELHVISKPLSYGGHTRLLEKMIAYEGGDVVVVRPYLINQSDLRLPEGVSVLSKPEGYDLPSLIDVISEYKTVYLHINPDDLLAAVAVGVAKAKTDLFVVFVNHADHVFSFGYANANVVAEVSCYGYKLTKERRGGGSSFIGIPVDLSGMRNIEPVNTNSIRILSAGSAQKYRPNSKLSFQDAVCKILTNVPNSTVTVIGPTLISDWWWWWAKIRFAKRLHVFRSLSYSKYLDALIGSDVYLDSYPMTGGTALPEVRSRNIPVTGILSGSSGYTPLDITRFSDVNRLIEELYLLSIGRGECILGLNNDPGTLDAVRGVHGKEHFSSRISEMRSRGIVSLSESDMSNVDINFYRKGWLESKVALVGFSDFYFFLRNFQRESYSILFHALFGVGFRNFIAVVGRLFLRAINRQ